MLSLKVELRANAEVRLGWDDLPAKVVRDRDSSRTLELARMARASDNKIDTFLRQNKLLQYRDKNGITYRGNSEVGYERVSSSDGTLDILSEFQRKGRARTPDKKQYPSCPLRPVSFTRLGRRRLLSAGGVFDQILARNHEGYLATFTLPGGTVDAYAVIATESGAIVNRLLQGLRRNFPTPYYFYAWEYQKRGALHLHLFCALPNNQVEAKDVGNLLHRAWYNSLKLAGDKHGVCLFTHKEGDRCTASEYWQFDFSRVEKSAARYISKYVSKGSPGDGSDKKESALIGSHFAPKRFWGLSRSLKKLIEEVEFSAALESCDKEEIQYCMDATRDMIASMQPNLAYSYEVDVCNKKQGTVFGRTYREIFWLNESDFDCFCFLFRKFLCRLLSQFPKHRQKWRGNIWEYKCTPIALCG